MTTRRGRSDPQWVQWRQAASELVQTSGPGLCVWAPAESAEADSVGPLSHLVVDSVQADKKVTPCAFLPWVDRVGGQPPDGRRPVVRRPKDGRRTVVRPDIRAAHVSSAAPKKKSFDRGGPVWPPRSNVTNDRFGGGVWWAAPPSQKYFEN